MAGRIISQPEADAQFGPAIESVTFDPFKLKTIIEAAGSVAMFRLVDGNAAILGEGRKSLYPDSSALIPAEDVYHLYSCSLLLELIEKGSGAPVCLENRKEVFSLTCGANTLEYGTLCPPICI